MTRRYLVVSLLLLAAACADDASEPAATTQPPSATTTTPIAPTTSAPGTTVPGSTTTQPSIPTNGEPLPPAALESLAAIFDPIIEPFGYRVGRAALIDRATYRETSDGTHLALYLTPFVDKSAEDFVADFMPLATAFVPTVFDAWPGLVSFDVCQEPYAWEGSTAPPGLTIFDIDRDAADQIDWESVDLAGLIAADAALDGLDIHAQREIRETDAWSAASGG